MLALGVFILAFLTYGSSFFNQFVWDDSHFFYQNIFTQSLAHIPEIFLSNTTAGAGVSSNYYRPIMTLSFALDHSLWAWNPVGLHFTNTFFHALNGIVLLCLLRLLGFGRVKSFLVSVLFIIHPIQTEAVTYLSSRGNILYTFFLFLSYYFFAYALYYKSFRIGIYKKTIILSRFLLLTFCPLLFLASILSKEGALTTIPVYAGILFVFALQKRLSFSRLHERYRGHFMVIMVCLLIALLYFGLRLTVLNFGDSLNYSGGHSFYSTHISARLLTFVTTIPHYVRLLLVPYPLYLERDTMVVSSMLNIWVLVGLSLSGFAVSAGFIEMRRRHTGWIAFGLLLIFANLASVSGIIPQTALIRENWLYMPMIGFYMAILVFGEMVWGRYLAAHTKALSIIFIFYCVTLICLTIQQNYNWRNSIAYFEHNLRFANTARLHLNLGNAYIGQKNYAKALYHLEKAVSISDVYPQTHYNIAFIYTLQGKKNLAKREYLKSITLDPNYLYGYDPLISLYESDNQPEKALPYMQRLMQIYPNDLQLTIRYAEDLYKSGAIQEADKQFGKAITLSRNDPKLIQAIAEMKRSK